MRVVYTDEALRDLDEALNFITSNYPTIVAQFEARLRTIERRIGAWPKSGVAVDDHPDIHVVPFIQYPYKLFYRVTDDAVEVLHIHHASRRGPWDVP
jgi:toxin ParE1/3/4